MQEKKEDKEIDFIKWFSELNKDSGKVAGGKGANLSEIYNLKIPVPPGFVVTAQAYDYFIHKGGLGNKIKELLSKINYEDTKQLNEVTEEIRKLILSAKFPKEMEEEILESYENLDAKDLDLRKHNPLDVLGKSSEPLFVAVRSSATTEDLAEASFAGQQDSFVNVKGNQDLLNHIKKCFASLFTSRATYYRNKKGFKHEGASLAVVVQKMVDSDKSGVIFSKNPTFQNDNIILEAVWGLGEGIVSGRITPDKHIISKELEIIEQKIANKKIAITRDSGGNKSIVKLTEEKSKQQVLKNHEVKKLAEIAIELEEHYKKPQDIEFAIEGSEIYIVQTRPITTMEKRVEKGVPRKIKGEVILTGLGASPGISSGKIKIITDLKDLDKIEKGDVLVTKMTNPDMVVTMQKSAAIVTDEGGMTAHAAIVSREMGIPAVVGTGEATTKLKENEIITVDGSSGKIYKGKISETIHKEVLPVTAETKTKIKVIVDLPSFAERAAKSKINSIGLTRIEGIIAESGKHPEYFLKQDKIQDYEEIIFKGINDIAKYFEEIWVRTSDIRSDEFQNLQGAPKEKEANPMLGMHGIRYGLKNPEILKAELKALKRIAEKNKKIGILMPQLISVEELKKVKEHVKEIGFENLKLGIMVETPSAVQIIGELCDEGIDFISFGTNDLTQYILAVDRGNTQVQEIFNEMHPAVLHQLEYVIRVCKRKKVETSICGQAGSKKAMAKFLVERGIDSISVNADAAKEISDYIKEVETSLIKGTDEEPRKYQQEKQEDFTKPQNIQEESSNENKIGLDNNLNSEGGSEPLGEKSSEHLGGDNQTNEELDGEEAVEETEKEKKEYEEEVTNEPEETPNIPGVEQTSEPEPQQETLETNNESKENEEEQPEFTEENPTLTGEEAIEETEKEKQEYLEENPKEEDEQPEFTKEEDNEIPEEEKDKDEVLNIF